MSEQVDAVVVGMGPGGEEVAGRLAEAGLAVVGVESRLVGGECPYWGCVPSKMMVRAASSLAEGRRVAGLAGTSTVAPDWAPVARRIRDEATDDWDDTVAVKRFEDKGGRFVRGQARLTAASTVDVEGVEFRATTAVVIAAGTQPAAPPIPGLAGTPYWTNRDAVETTRVPRSLAVIGGGAVGLEFAQVFARFGSEVTVIEAADRLLPVEEPEAGDLIADVLRPEALGVMVGARIDRVVHDGETFRVEVHGAAPVQAERLLVATGRRTDLVGLGVAAAGLDDSARFVAVDEHLRAGPGLWAVGDITAKGAFTHVAVYQARIAAADILGRPHEPADYRALPRVTFTDPELGAVGLTEDQARARGLTVSTAVTQVPSSARGWIHKSGNDGLTKLVADRRRRCSPRGHLSWAGRRRSPLGARRRRARSGAHLNPRRDDLRLPHLPQGHRRRRPRAAMSTAKPRLDGVSGPATRSDVKCSTPTGAVPGCDAGLGTAVRFVAAELRDIWRSRRASDTPAADSSPQRPERTRHG